MLVSEDLLSIR
uniref:Uncharacterized protein n=1 Tax=Lepeophtheirus salmonis TaxID=72036 RepID=A0A0K2TGA6_LEPSM